MLTARGWQLLQSIHLFQDLQENVRMIPSRAFTKLSVAGLVLGAALSAPSGLYAAPVLSPMLAAQDAGNSVTAAVQDRLNKKQFQNVKVSVNNGAVTLSGTVDVYEYKADADKRVHKVKGVTSVNNEIQVAGPSVSDDELKQKLLEKLEYDRVGYGNAFNSISLGVQNGVVTLGGHARTDVDKDSAIALVSTYPGVKDVVEDIQIDPVSIMDDRIRLQVARAVYGYPSLTKYATDPGKPIRISVQNGNVELYGEVDNKADKDVAYLRANQVPGVFSVKNYLTIANESNEKPPKQ
jgi:hyperosmotically inducible periplasmic protein